MNHTTCNALLMLVVFITLVGSGLVLNENGLEQCQGSFTYLLEVDSGGYYGLVGLPLNLRSQYANHTTRISVNGTYYPSNPTQYLHPDPNFRGLIYVTQYLINGVTSSFAQTVVIVSGTVTSTSTYTNQLSPTTMTVGTGVVTLTPIGVSGLLDYTQEYCVTTLFTTTSSGSTERNSGLSIPGFTAVSVILGLIVGLSVLVIRKTTKAGIRRSRVKVA